MGVSSRCALGEVCGGVADGLVGPVAAVGACGLPVLGGAGEAELGGAVLGLVDTVAMMLGCRKKGSRSGGEL